MRQKFDLARQTHVKPGNLIILAQQHVEARNSDKGTLGLSIDEEWYELPCFDRCANTHYPILSPVEPSDYGNTD